MRGTDSPVILGLFWQFCDSLKLKRQRFFLDFGECYVHQIFGSSVIFSGSYENATTFG